MMVIINDNNTTTATTITTTSITATTTSYDNDSIRFTCVISNKLKLWVRVLPDSQLKSTYCLLWVHSQRLDLVYLDRDSNAGFLKCKWVLELYSRGSQECYLQKHYYGHDQWYLPTNITPPLHDYFTSAICSK